MRDLEVIWATVGMVKYHSNTILRIVFHYSNCGHDFQIDRAIKLYSIQLYSGGRGGDRDSSVGTHSGIQQNIKGFQILT